MDNIFEDNTGLQVKAWLDKNGKMIIGTLAVAIAITLGHEFYQRQQANNLTEASEMYDQYQQSLMKDNEDAMVASAETLREDFPNTAYATSVALLEASRASFDKRYADAEAQLVWLQKNGKPFAQPLATLRLAQIKFAQNDIPGAQAVLDAFPVTADEVKGAYYAGYEELRGDIAAAEGNRSKAGLHYANALTAYNAQNFTNVLLQMKTETYH